MRRNVAIYTGSVDTAPVLKYNLNGYFSAAIHDSVSDQSAPPLVRADGGVFLVTGKLSVSVCRLLLGYFTSEIDQ